VAIIGGGFCGTLTAVHLLRRAAPGTRVLLMERSGDFGPGVAYGTCDDRHVLNVPAARMSALPEAPDDLVDWAGVAPDAYVPRRVYGEYLRARLAGAAAHSAARLERTVGEVERVRPARAAIELVLRDGRRIACDRAVLAVGNLPGAPPCELPDDPRVVGDPWLPGALTDGGTASTLIVGTGPTAVDVALSVCDESPAARVAMVSRHGRLPCSHLPGLRDPAPPPVLGTGPLRLRALERELRAHGRAWEVRRHRLAPSVAAAVASLRMYGRLTVLARRGGARARAARAGRRGRRRRLRIARGACRLSDRHDDRVRISAKVDYAMRALVELAANGDGSPVTAERLADAQGIPQKFLQNILLELRRAGIVASHRGPDGGHALAKAADKITVADVIRAVDGPLGSVAGHAPEDMEYQGSTMRLRDTWVAVRASVRGVLEGITLDDIASDHLPDSIGRLLGEHDAWVRR